VSPVSGAAAADGSVRRGGLAKGRWGTNDGGKDPGLLRLPMRLSGFRARAIVQGSVHGIAVTHQGRLQRVLEGTCSTVQPDCLSRATTSSPALFTTIPEFPVSRFHLSPPTQPRRETSKQGSEFVPHPLLPPRLSQWLPSTANTTTTPRPSPLSQSRDLFRRKTSC
jgi:hypothetical protein